MAHWSVLSCFPARMEMVGSAGNDGTYLKMVQSSKNQNILFCSLLFDGTSDSTFSATLGFTVLDSRSVWQPNESWL